MLGRRIVLGRWGLERTSSSDSNFDCSYAVQPLGRHRVVGSPDRSDDPPVAALEVAAEDLHAHEPGGAAQQQLAAHDTHLPFAAAATSGGSATAVAGAGGAGAPIAWYPPS